MENSLHSETKRWESLPFQIKAICTSNDAARSLGRAYLAGHISRAVFLERLFLAHLNTTKPPIPPFPP